MNPFEKFYKVKKTYEETKRMAASFDDIYEVDLEGNLANDFKIFIKLNDGIFEDIKNDEKWEMYQVISVYLQAHRDEIKEHLIKKLEERMEVARDIVLKDFKLIGSIKGGK